MNENIQHVEENEISLGEIFAIIKKRFWFLVIITLVGGLLLGIYAFGVAKPKYKSTGSVMIQVKTGTDTTSTIESQRLIDTVVQIIKMETPYASSEALVDRGVSLSPKTISDNMSVTNQSNGLVISIGYTSTDKAQARVVTEAIIDSLIAMANDTDGKLALTFKDNLTKIRVNDAVYTSPNKPLLVLVGMVLGGTIGLILVFTYEMTNSGYKTKEELESQTKVQVLGTIPTFSVKGGKL